MRCERYDDGLASEFDLGTFIKKGYYPPAATKPPRGNFIAAKQRRRGAPSFENGAATLDYGVLI